MRLSLLVPPGFGKYRFAERLAEKYKLNIIDINEILLKEVNSGTETGIDIKRQVDNSKPVSDDNIIIVLNKTLKEEIYKDGFIMTGLPSNKLQANAIEKALKRQKKYFAGIIYLEIDYDLLMELLTGQMTCRVCNTMFNIYNSPPVMDGICDECGAKLYKRTDDREENISRRIREYESYREPLSTYYTTNFITVRGDIDEKALFPEIEKNFKKLLDDYTKGQVSLTKGIAEKKTATAKTAAAIKKSATKKPVKK